MNNFFVSLNTLTKFAHCVCGIVSNSLTKFGVYYIYHITTIAMRIETIEPKSTSDKFFKRSYGLYSYRVVIVSLHYILISMYI